MKIAVILPYKESFSKRAAGAIALSVKDFTLWSRFKDGVTIYGGKKSDPFSEVRFDGIEIKRRGFKSRSRSYAEAVAKKLEESQPDIIEIHNRPWIANYLRKHFGGKAKVILHLHNDPLTVCGLSTWKQRRKALEQMDGVFCVSDFVKKRFMLGVDNNLSKLHTVHNGIDISSIPNLPKENTVFYAGRIVEEKGVLELAEALVKASKSLKGWKVLFAGADKPKQDAGKTSYEKRTHKLLSSLSNFESVGFVEHDKVMEYFAKAAISVIPSTWQEPFGRVALEAAASSCAIVSSSTGGLKEIIGDAGITVEPVTAEGLAEGIARLAQDSALRQKLQEKAKQRALEIFDIRKVAELLDTLRTDAYKKVA